MRKLVILVIISCACCRIEVHKEYYFDNTLKEQYSMCAGQFNGEYKAFYPTGIPEATGEFDNGKMVNEWKYFYPNGKLKSIQIYSDGSLTNIDFYGQNGDIMVKKGTGCAIIFYPHGDTLSIATYENNKLNGRSANWYENGQISQEIFYHDGRAIGNWRYWDKSGDLIEIKKVSE